MSFPLASSAFPEHDSRAVQESVTLPSPRPRAQALVCGR